MTRQDLLHNLVERLCSDTLPAAPVIALCAEAGMGKSTLLAEILLQVQSHFAKAEVPVLSVMAACSAPLAGQNIGAVEALQPWAQLLAQLVLVKTKANVPSLVKSLAIAWVKFIPVIGDVIESASDTIDVIREHKSAVNEEQGKEVEALNQQQIFQQYINVLREAATKARLILALDDVHWADESSLNLLFSAARQLAGSNVCFVVAYRDLPTVADAQSSGSSLHTIHHELMRYSLIDEFAVPPLTPDDIDKLFRERYGDHYRDNDDLEHFIAHSSGGNPLFVQSWLRELEDKGYLKKDSGEVKDNDISHLPIPSTIRAVLEQRLSLIDRESIELLRYASVEGEEFSSLMLQRVSGHPPLKLLQTLRLIEHDSALIESLGKAEVYATQSSRYRFRHTMLRDILYQSLGQEERELVHAQHVEVLEPLWNDPQRKTLRVQWASRLAVHARETANWQLCAEAWIAIAEQASRVYSQHAWVTALDEADTVIRSLEHNTTTHSLRAQSLELRAELHILRDELDDAARCLRAAEHDYALAGDQQNDIDCLLRRASVAARQFRMTEFRELCDTAIQRATDISYTEGMAGAQSMMGIAYETDGDFATAEACYRKAIDYAQAPSMEKRRASALVNLSRVYSTRQQLVEAKLAIEEAIEIFSRIGHLQGLTRALNVLGIVHKDLHHYEQALTCFQQAREIDIRIGDVDGEASRTTNLGVTLYDQQRFSEALDYFQKSVQLKRGCSDVLGLGIALHALGSCLDQLGSYDEAGAAHEEARATFASVQDAMWMVNADYGLAMHYVFLRRFDEAETLLHNARQRAESMNARQSIEMIESGFQELNRARKPG